MDNIPPIHPALRDDGVYLLRIDDLKSAGTLVVVRSGKLLGVEIVTITDPASMRLLLSDPHTRITKIM